MGLDLDASAQQTAIGVALAILGNMLNGLGYVIQKAAHNRIQARPLEEQHSFTREPLWIGGYLTFLTGSVVNAVALGFGPQSLLTPMQSFSLATNAMLAPRFLGEKLRGKDVFATLMIAGGAAMAVYFGPSSSGTYTTQQLYSFFLRPVFGGFALSLVGLSLLLWVSVRCLERSLAVRGVKLTKSLDQPEARFLALSYTFLAGVCSGFAILITKCCAEMIGSTIDGDNQFDQWTSYLMLAIWLVVNVLLEYFRQRALGHFDALFVVPVFQVFSMIFSTVMGGLFFYEFFSMEPKQLVLFFVALGIICLSVYVLSLSEASELWRQIQKPFHFLVPPKVLHIFEKKLDPDSQRKLRRMVSLRNLNVDGYNPEVYNSCWGGCLEMGRAVRAWRTMRNFVNEEIIQALREGLTPANIKQGLVNFLRLPVRVWDGMTDAVVEAAKSIGEGMDSAADAVVEGMHSFVELIHHGSGHKQLEEDSLVEPDHHEQQHLQQPPADSSGAVPFPASGAAAAPAEPTSPASFVEQPNSPT